ncbi:MAG: hypothetical protein ACE5I1_23300, partial [bacterium]
SMCRQIDGCANNVSEFVMGTKGYSNCRNTIHNLDGTLKWEYSYVSEADASVDSTQAAEMQKNRKLKISPYVQEHIDVVTAIRTGKPYVEAEQTAISTMTAILGRIAAYTGKEVTWDELMESDMRLGPESYSMGTVSLEHKGEIPTQGTQKGIA